MKILLICSSPHKEKSRTFLLAKEVLRAAAQEGAEVESLHLDDFKVFFCKHCEACHKNIMHCSIADDAQIILNKMLEADGIILASPNYINQVTASMKALMDRSAHFIHCKRLLGKYICAVVSSGSGFDNPVLDYISYYGHTCGAQYSGGVSSAAQVIEKNKEEAFKLGRKLAQDIREKKAYLKQLEIIEQGRERFCKLVELMEKEWPGEYQYWKDKGWI